MYKQGDILIIPIPFTDLTSSKKRPVLVLSNDYLSEGNLKVDSCIRADKIYTLSQNIIVKKFGEVNEDIINKVKDKINKLLK
ncbi:MAG TPA: type II toxin-antitoxin system PemK/MazF family toxin [Syntrophomonadaceae bacterium]|nr:type II toxin-antitoxin system PemK/MazF family toxin [Syntrophomonadaceae bacterium]